MTVRRPFPRAPALRGVLMLAVGATVLAAVPAAAQDIGGTLLEDGTLTARTVQLILLITVLSLAPGLAIMVTCFPFMVTVFAILRQAIGLPQSPPNMLIVSLALFLTWFVMEPVFDAAWTQGLGPLVAGELDVETAFPRTMDPFARFMQARVDPVTLDTLQALRPGPAPAPEAAPALSVLVPSFLLSEISRAFEIGFLIFLPFLVIDLVVAAVLMSMGMMMVPPAIGSLPFKLAFFVVADGWALIAAALVRGYS